MPVEIYMSGKFDTSYEREALSVIAADLDTLFRDTSDLCIILANYTIQGGQVDITILKKDSIIIVELKDCSLPFTATENGIWQCPNGHIVGNKGENPFKQVLRYRGKWKDFLGEQKSKFNCLKTITDKDERALWHKCFVAISPSLHAEVKNDIDNWRVRLIGSNELSKYVSFETNKHLNFSDNELRSIPRLLSIPLVSLESVTGAKVRPQAPPPPPKIPQVSFEPVSRSPELSSPPREPQVSFKSVNRPLAPPPPPKIPQVSLEPVSQPPDPPPPPKVSFEPVSQPPDPPPPPKIPQVSFESVSGATVRSQAPRKPQFGIIVGIVAAIIDLFLVAWIITTLMPFISGTRNATLAGETPSIPPSTPFTTTAIPSAIPSATAIPSAIPSAESADSSPEPSVAPAGSNSQPVFHGTGRDTTVEPSWYPCQEGQIKGNKNPKIYHISTGRSYNKTFREVTCFSTAAEAEAAGFRAAGN